MSDQTAPADTQARHRRVSIQVEAHQTFGARLGLVAKRLVFRLSRYTAATITLMSLWLSIIAWMQVHSLNRSLMQLDRQPVITQHAEGAAYSASSSCDAIRPTFEAAREARTAPGKPHETLGRDLARQDAQYMVQEAFKQCTKDKNGRRDYAFLQSGGYVISTLTSKSFVQESAWLRITRALTFQNRELAKVPLMGDGTFGNCWPLLGSAGQLGIGLSRPIQITGLTIEHIGAELAGDEIGSAPKEFQLWGVIEDEHKRYIPDTLLHQGIYDVSKPSSIQTFEIKDEHRSQIHSRVLLKILSNHGNPDFTCLYRIRVHGNPP